MDRSDAAHDARRSGRGLSARGSALVCLDDPHAELTAVLILQELDLSVDLATDPDATIRWARQARYEVIVVGGRQIPLRTVGLRLRHAAPDARLVLLAEGQEAPEGLAPLGIQVLVPPVDVNALMRSLWPAS